MAKRETDPDPGLPREFATTRWSVVLASRQGDSGAQTALAELCKAYWYPLYAYLRRRGIPAEDARDVTQDFFARLLEKRLLARVDPGRGKFRSFLLACLTHFLANERDRAAAKKRGGGRVALSIDVRAGEARYALEPADPMTPERLYERRWALTLLERALERLRGALAAEGKTETFERLQPYLTGEVGTAPYAEAARDLGTSEEAVKQTVHRLRRRFRQELRAEIAETVTRPEEVDEEIRELFESLGA